MRAIVLRQFGPPEVLNQEEVPEPKAAASEIVLWVHAVSVNRTLDCTVRAGKYPVSIKMPHVLGVDPAGEVVEVGKNLAAEVMRLTDGDGVDIVCENISDPTLWSGAFDSLAIGGRLVTAGGPRRRRRDARRKKTLPAPHQHPCAAGTNPPDVAKALSAAGQGKIRAIINRIMPLSEAAEAHRIVEKNQISGKIILEPAQN